MKIVLLEDIANVGRAGEVKEVADGYGRNFLLPKKLALLATPSALKAAEAQLQKEKEKEQRFAAEITKLAQQLEGLLITFKEKASSEDRLYGSVRDSDVARELSQLTGQDIAKEKIELEEPIRQLGEYEVTVRFSQDLAPKIKVIVTREE